MLVLKGNRWCVYSLLHEKPAPTEQEIEDNFDGNLCRCTGYRAILDSMKSFGVDSSRAGSGLIDIEVGSLHRSVWLFCVNMALRILTVVRVCYCIAQWYCNVWICLRGFGIALRFAHWVVLCDGCVSDVMWGFWKAFFPVYHCVKDVQGSWYLWGFWSTWVTCASM